MSLAILLTRASPAPPASPVLLRERDAKEKTENGSVRGGRKKNSECSMTEEQWIACVIRSCEQVLGCGMESEH